MDRNGRIANLNAEKLKIFCVFRTELMKLATDDIVGVKSFIS